MKKLPIGVSTLDKIINGGYAYVDKTAMVHQLAENGSYYFLSRPRRFGKSLFIDTLKEAFEGNRDRPGTDSQKRLRRQIPGAKFRNLSHRRGI